MKTYQCNRGLKPRYDIVAFLPPVHTETTKTIMKTQTFEYTIWKLIRVTGALVGNKFAIRTSSIILKFPLYWPKGQELIIQKTLHISNAQCNSNYQTPVVWKRENNRLGFNFADFFIKILCDILLQASVA